MGSIQIRKTKTGEKRFKAIVRLKGHPPETKTFRRKTDAKIWIGKTEDAIREGSQSSLLASRKHTLNELIDRYIDEILPTKPKSLKKQKAQLTWWKNKLGAYSLIEVTPDRLSKCKNELLGGKVRGGQLRSPGTVIRYMAALSHVFSIAVREYGWLEANPMQRVTKPKEPKGRVRFLSEEEMKDLLKACKADRENFLYPLVVVALSTGMRAGEIKNLEWDDVDLEKGRAILRDTKNSEIRTVPLVSLALELLKVRREENPKGASLVFPFKIRGGWKPWEYRSAWERALKKAGVRDFKFHDLRHTAASYLAMNGATTQDIAAILGHKTLQMVQRYSHLSEPHTRGVVESMNEKMFGENR